MSYLELSMVCRYVSSASSFSSYDNYTFSGALLKAAQLLDLPVFSQKKMFLFDFSLKTLKLNKWSNFSYIISHLSPEILLLSGLNFHSNFDVELRKEMIGCHILRRTDVGILIRCLLTTISLNTSRAKEFIHSHFINHELHFFISQRWNIWHFTLV